ncbi:hypothetical protein [uncultured Chitinophaga sp.]|jgi:hypothetical protein|uniref:hypothetical protein n=1 Tax=uncultured Chitinophaga sp. TaxID=339340 RepID=UPI00262FCA1C|nr:hypothetical protein [uncultured Chitinophaga sp.]
MATTLNFYERAERLGHSVEALKGGQAIISSLMIPDIDRLKEVLGGDVTEPVLREKRLRDLFGDKLVSPAEDDGSETAILNRVQRFIYGNDPLSDLDRQRTKHLFPFEVKAASYPDQRITEKWDLTDKGPVVLNIGKLTLEDGGYIVIHNTALTFYADVIERNGSAKTQSMYDINILGATGATGCTGSAGNEGGVGGPGVNGQCNAEPGKRGETGQRGATGGTGSPGGDGLPSLAASIMIGKSIGGSTQQLHIMTRSGTGGAGGIGGTGGKGGRGGVGGDGVTCGCDGTNGGNGGNGGDGGRGGTGGSGGNGTDANGNIVIKVPAEEAAKIITHRFAAPAGIGATGGPGGEKGEGGDGGREGKHHSRGSRGGGGVPGNEGPRGQQGAKEGQPAVIVLDKE